MFKMLTVIGTFAIAMGLLESAVVIYLRALMYPNGFSFPLESLNWGLGIVEISRELATLIMLGIVGYLAGHNRITRLAYFLFSFAIWDIFYYVFLKIFLNWPESIFTWDVLFLIPVMWVGPVWTPLLLASTMIVLAIFLIKINSKGQIPLGWNLLPMILGTLVCILSFCLDPMQFLNAQSNHKWYHFDALFNMEYIPSNFPLGIFLIGFAAITFGIFRYVYNNSFSHRKVLKGQML